jgi:hypothetical protein
VEQRPVKCRLSKKNFLPPTSGIEASAKPDITIRIDQPDLGVNALCAYMLFLGLFVRSSSMKNHDDDDDDEDDDIGR